MHRVATVSGPAEGCQKIQEIISRIINEQSSQFVMNGQAFGEYGGQTQGYGMYGQQQQQPQQQQYGAAAGGEDYSAQWAAYYAAQATSQTAAAPAPASAGTTTGNAASQGETPAADAYHDAFFRYAYHYGEDAARQYYGAWSPAAGTANPYGVNPNGTTAAPAADGA
jgi:far upstream element-binding protein